jgi:Uma2 family endonuclease
LEPDNCYWIAHEPRVRGKRKIDLQMDPPPDLAVEIDIARSSLDRLGIYAALGVPEIWRFDGRTLTFHLLGPDGRYEARTYSRAFPQLTTAVVARFVALEGKMDQNAIIRKLRLWVRQHLATPGSA